MLFIECISIERLVNRIVFSEKNRYIYLFFSSLAFLHVISTGFEMRAQQSKYIILYTVCHVFKY